MKNINHISLFVLFIIVLTGCISTKGVTNESVKSAISLQAEIINDPLFSKILIELENEGKIDWQEGSTSQIEESFEAYQNRVYWLLDMFENRGVYDSSSVFLWRKWNPWSSTTAVTNTCGNSTKLNKWKLKRDKFSLVNTLIHERIHSFCLIHPSKQTREANKCDLSYIAGDLAEILILKKYEIKNQVTNNPICPELVEKVYKYNLLELE